MPEQILVYALIQSREDRPGHRLVGCFTNPEAAREVAQRDWATLGLMMDNPNIVTNYPEPFEPLGEWSDRISGQIVLAPNQETVYSISLSYLMESSPYGS